MPAPYSASQIANWILGAIDRTSGDSITHLKLQKLIYYAQAWSLALPNRSCALFDEEMQAWAHGPVAESVFQEYRGSGWDALPAPDEVPDIAEADEDHLKEILAIFGEYSAKHLERMTHNEEPWLQARGDLSPEARSNAIIPKEYMADFYRDLYEKAENGEE
jgi:uncharacterized phage-associated protein